MISTPVLLRRVLRDSRGGSVGAAGIGTMLAVVLQSATAVALLAAGFAGAGLLSVGRGLAIMLGADVGSALVVQILAVDLRWFVPVLLLAGGLLRCKDRAASRPDGRPPGHDPKLPFSKGSTVSLGQRQGPSKPRAILTTPPTI